VPRVLRVLRRAVIAAGLLTLAGLLWIAAGWSTGIDRWLDVTQPPVPSEAIVVLGGGTGMGNLPLTQGWERITTAVRLFRDGLAPVVIFTGSGSTRASQSEVYANAAQWMGLPRSAMMLEATAEGTADHGFALLTLTLPDGRPITTETRLLVVTSPFHSRRALMAFSRAGFRNVRIAGDHTPDTPAEEGTPEGLVNTVEGYEPSTKTYDDVLLRLAYGSFDFFVHLREAGAILVSRIRGR
jgi:uncharacterized SAM-binding protein YcdF (DUF218 family)